MDTILYLLGVVWSWIGSFAIVAILWVGVIIVWGTWHKLRRAERMIGINPRAVAVAMVLVSGIFFVPTVGAQEGGENLLPVYLVDTATEVTLKEVAPGATYRFTQALLDVMGLYTEVPSGHPLDGQVQSVVLSLDGDVMRTESAAPYSLFGDNSGDFFPGSMLAGAHTLTLKLYSAKSAQGTLVDTQVVSFVLKKLNDKSMPWLGLLLLDD